MTANRDPSRKPRVGIIVGSKTDLSYFQKAVETLKQFEIPFEVDIGSAHRSPDRVTHYAQTAEERGLQAIIVGAGAAAHLAGTIAARTLLPVLGVPLPSSPLKGLDALLSTVQMPSGIPVATLAIGESGAVNAALLAVEILGLRDSRLRKRLQEYREELNRKLDTQNRDLQKGGFPTE